MDDVAGFNQFLSNFIDRGAGPILQGLIIFVIL
jgi:hypothetical protein